MSREAMQIALDALEANLANWAEKTKAVKALRQALETEPEALRLADALDAEFVQGRISNSTGREAAVELRRLHVWEKAYEAVCDERDAIIRDSDKAHALLRWVEKEMRYAGWDIRLNDQHGRTDVYEAIKEFLA